MPTKPNRAGEQQNYVPAGNGDASGEYGDNASGSNVHFQNFKQPDKPAKDDTKNVKTENADNIQVKAEDGEKTKYSSFEEHIKGITDEAFIEGAKKAFEAGSEDGKGLIDFMVDKADVRIRKISGIANYSGAVNLDTNDFREQGIFKRDTGEVLYHEFWHCFDERFAHNIARDDGEINTKLISDEDSKHLLQNNKSMIDAVALNWNLSTGKVLSNGMTLYETIQKETRQMSKNGVWEQMKKDMANEIDAELEKRIPNAKQTFDQYNMLKNKYEQEAKELYPLYNNGVKDDNAWDKRDVYMEEKIGKDLTERYEEIKRTRTNVENYTHLLYMSLSDMYGMTKKIPYGFCGGHRGSYGKRKGIIAHEFIAEYGSAITRNSEMSKKEVELFKKYMPEASKYCQELCDMIIKKWKEVK